MRSTIKTPLGLLLAIADEKALFELAFVEREESIPSKKSAPILSIEKELHEYFQGRLKRFKTPIALAGTPFQCDVWSALQKIPFGETRSYSDVAKAIRREKAVRAVGNANGTNRLVIIVPCHRVIQANGELGGYNCGLEKKRWLLAHESSMVN